MVLVGLNDLLADWGIPGEYDLQQLPSKSACKR
jgi:hypothetical protein